MASTTVDMSKPKGVFMIGAVSICYQHEFTFYGDDKEDPHAHLQNFIDCTRLIKINGVSQQAIRLLLFHFTLKDSARKWYKTLKKGSIRSWDQMAQVFLERYFSTDRSDTIRRELNNFAQKDDETMRDAWERFRDLENSCPHHGIQDWLLIKNFYSGLYDNIKINIDSLSGGAFKRLDATQGRDLLDHCARNYTWYPIPNPRRSGHAKHQVHEITTRDERIAELEAKLASYQSAQGSHLYSNECGACGEEGHKSPDCPLAKINDDMAQVNSLNSEPSYYPRHIFNRSYSLDEGEQRNWEHMNDPNLKNTMQKSTLDRPYQPKYNYKGQNQQPPRRDQQPNNSNGPFSRKSVYNTDGVPPVVQEFMHQQGKFNLMMAEGLDELKATTNELKGSAASLQRLERMMEQQFSRPQGKLPGQPLVNPNAEIKAMHVLRSGREYQDPPMPADEQHQLSGQIDQPPVRSDQPIVEPDQAAQGHVEVQEPVRVDQTTVRSDQEGKKAQPKDKSSAETPVPAYQPPVPFPQRLVKSKEDAQFRIFWEILKQMQITIPFTDAIAHVPIYAKFLKELCTGKRSMEELKTVALTYKSSEALKNRMPPKLEDPGRFVLPCTIGRATIMQALCDMGASISLMPKSVFETIGIGELTPTSMTLKLADSTTRLPLGVLKDVPVQVGKFLVPGDFVVMEMEVDKEVPIILGRPFLRTAGVMMDALEGTILVRVGGERLLFSIDHAMKCPDPAKTCFMIQEIPEIEESLEDQYQIALETYQAFLCDMQEAIGVEETMEVEEEGNATLSMACSTTCSIRPDPCSSRPEPRPGMEPQSGDLFDPTRACPS
ncbi:F7F22.17 [Rhynchospora pubera]|uniref:F7F22.17 n=1 Tax=Rhynchospora pubera TaxID=906938 RepID=A0AAV8CN80_9POAL|nr:F7F22.17 [Rhynchospora pubera]